jgi:hypothetical protein
MKSNKSFYFKYLKYKKKYLEIKNIFGGGNLSAKNSFLLKILKDAKKPSNTNQSVLSLLNNDLYLKKELFKIMNGYEPQEQDNINLDINKLNNDVLTKYNEAIVEYQDKLVKYEEERRKYEEELKKQGRQRKGKPPKLNETEIILKKLNEIPELNIIFDNIILSLITNENMIDKFMTMYLAGNMGIRNSIKNSDIFVDNMELFILLQNNGKLTGNEINEINTLTDLRNFIDSNYDVIITIQEQQRQKEQERQFYKKIKELGESAVIVELNTPNVIIYSPTSMYGAIYYGAKTKWCTAAHNDNMFDHYNEIGKLYIIVLKHTQQKYQIQFENNQIMDALDNPTTIKHIINELHDDEFERWLEDKFRMLCINKKHYCMYALREIDKLKNDDEIVNIALNYDPSLISLVNPRFYDNTDLMLNLAKRNPYIFSYASDRIKNDENIVLSILDQNPLFLRYVNIRFRDDTDLILKLVEKNKEYFDNASDRIKNDKDIIYYLIIDKNIDIFKYLSNTLKDNSEFVTPLLEKRGYLFELVSKRLKDDENIALIAIKNNWTAMNHVSNRLKNDYNFIMKAVEIDGYVLAFLPEHFKNNYDIVLKAVQQNGDALKYASNNLKNNYDIVSAAVKQYRLALRYASDNLKKIDI